MIHQCSVLKRNQSRQLRRRTPEAAEPQRLKTLENLQRAIVNTVEPRLLQYRAVHHDSERAAETQLHADLRLFIN
jgi:hypothetical protein